ncbi:hypothetical protein B0H19DRAFT_1269987 [Mycena capillaripes]|nr:hypothetical protein B0H19DRAFT_1269987 [Mycena capillaripes]
MPYQRGDRQSIFDLMGADSLSSPSPSRPSPGISRSQTRTFQTYGPEGDPCFYSADGSSACFIMDWSTSGPCFFHFGCTGASTPVTSPPLSLSMSSSTTTSTPTASAPSSSKNPVAIGSTGFIAIIVAGAFVLLVVGIKFLGRRRCRQRCPLDAVFAGRKTTMAQKNDPEMCCPGFLAQSRATSVSKVSSNNKTTSLSQFLSESPPPDRGQRVAPALTQPRRPLRSASRPVREFSSDSEPSGSTTSAESNPKTMGEGAQSHQEWQRHTQIETSDVVSETRPSTPENDDSTRSTKN